MLSKTSVLYKTQVELSFVSYSLIDGIKFVIYSITPDILPHFQAVPSDMRNEVDSAAASALSFPGMFDMA